MTAAASISSNSAPAMDIKRPLMSVWGAALLLNCSEEVIEDRIKDGKIEWAFNIALIVKPQRGCVRVFTRCVLDFKTGVKNRFTEPYVLEAIFPAARPRFRTPEIAIAFHCGTQHVRSLVKNGLWKAIPGTGDSVNKSPLVPRATLTNFLSSRRIT